MYNCTVLVQRIQKIRRQTRFMSPILNPGYWVFGTPVRSPSPLPRIEIRTSHFVQRLATSTYWRNGTQLMRASAVSVAGVPQGEILATGVQSLTATLVFTDGHEAGFADGADADVTNNYDQIAAIRLRFILQADRTSPRINNGVLLTRAKEWFLVPRNLVYERNRIP